MPLHICLTHILIKFYSRLRPTDQTFRETENITGQFVVRAQLISGSSGRSQAGSGSETDEETEVDTFVICGDLTFQMFVAPRAERREQVVITLKLNTSSRIMQDQMELHLLSTCRDT